MALGAFIDSVQRGNGKRAKEKVATQTWVGCTGTLAFTRTVHAKLLSCILSFTHHSIKTGNVEKGLIVCRAKGLLISVVCIMFSWTNKVKVLHL